MSLLLIAAAVLGFADEPPGTVRVGRDTADNIRVRLVAAGRDNTAGRFLHARFVTVGDGTPRELRVRLVGHHDTTHALTLLSIITSSYSDRPAEGGAPAAAGLREFMRKADRFEAVFSVPPDPKGNDLSRWYLVSLKVPGASAAPDPR